MIVAGPFLGEFGWEVAMWVPWLRWMREEMHASSEFVAICRPGHAGLYDNFADRTIEHDALPTIRTVDCANAFVSGHGKLSTADYFGLAKLAFSMKTDKVMKQNYISPLQLQYSWPRDQPPILRRHHHRFYGTPNQKESGWVVVHARDAAKQPERNWSITRWNELIEAIDAKHVIAIGSLTESLCPDGCEDLRGKPLSEVLLAASKCEVGIGPSSGPMHLMNSCGTPVVWWSGNSKDLTRYSKHWNYEKLPNVCAAESWNPIVDEVDVAVKVWK